MHSPQMNELTFEIIQKIVNLLSTRDYIKFRKLSRRFRSLNQFPYLDFARYKQLTFKENLTTKFDMSTFVPFKLHKADLTDRQFLFLALKGHHQELLRSFSSGGWMNVNTS
jgi:F-box domain